MGVTGLWHIVQPCARPIKLETLNRKRLAVDASIWIYQFLKAVRDKEGRALRNSHIVGFFRRICKLLFFGIKPVFVFDGGAPILKRQTIVNRKKRREGRREDAARTAGKLLAVQMQRIVEEEAERKRKHAEGEVEVDDEEPLPAPDDMVYGSELGMNKQQRLQSRKFVKKDAYHLPELGGSVAEMGRPDDPRIMSTEELEEYARQYNNGEDINLYDFSKIDFDSDFFTSLPIVDQYNILNAARLRSRLRMGLGKEQLESMFPDRMEFSRFQIQRVQERNNLTQRLMRLTGFDTDNTIALASSGRIAGERNREYMLVKNEGVEGGWALGVISIDKTVGERSNPYDVDKMAQKVRDQQMAHEQPDVEDEDEFEDVPIEGLNRLPKLKQRPVVSDGISGERRQFNPSRKPQSRVNEDLNPLFVEADEDQPDDIRNVQEEEELQRAIAMSLESQHGVRDEAEEDVDFEDIPMPEYEQTTVQEQRPIGRGSGQAIAHIVNNRSTAAVPERRASAESSDDELDISKAIAASRKKTGVKKALVPAPVQPNVKNPFDGPLPFESLSFKTSIFGKQNSQPADEDEDGEKNAEGGFLKEKEKNKPKPLPPWLAGSDDIRSSVQQQRENDLALNAADRERALEDERLYQRKNGPIEIESSDEGSDVEFVDVQPRRSTIDLTGDDRFQTVQSPQHPGDEAPVHVQAIDDTPVVPALAAEDQIPPVTIEKERQAEEESEEEFVEWSDSDHEQPVEPAAESSAQAVETAEPSPEPDFEDVTIPDHAPAAEPSPEPTFEDVAMPDQPDADLVAQTAIEKEANEKSPSPLYGDVDVPEAFPTTTGPQTEGQDDVFTNADFDDFSDPEEEELLVQLAEEVEEHARFANSLNNKSAEESHQDYERELRALRNQQKKDRRDADEVTQVMITECQALLRLFGLPYITAPMEAEAQCAELVSLGLVDGIVTDDSDTFLFGGTRVYKNMFNSNKYVECYLASDLEKELSLSRSQLISVAHLLGSDYTEGLPGIGPVTAMEIISEFPGENGLNEFKDWWHDVQQNMRPKEADAGSVFRKKFRRAQAKKLFLPPGFPSPAVSEAYMKPDVDHSPEEFQWGVPDLDNLRSFLMSTIGWSQERTDEVLVPVIKDMNRRATEGTQSNITRFLDGPTSLGVGAKDSFAPRNRGPANSQRLSAAMTKLKAKTGSSKLSRTFADEAAEWANKNELNNRPGQVKPASKRRASKGPESGRDNEDKDVETSADADGEEVESVSQSRSRRRKTKA